MKSYWYILLPGATAAVFVLVAWFTAFTGGYDPPDTPDLGLETLQLPTYPLNTAPVVIEDRQGVMVLDTLHFNHYFAGELESLLSKVTNLGYDIDFFGDRLAFDLPDELERAAKLEEGLRGADSLLVVAPFFDYTAREAEIVRRFVDKGGRLVLLGDPTRVRRVNQLATALGLNFEADFLYNIVEHDANYRNIIVRDFTRHQVTSGLGSIVLYTAGSITGSGQPLAWGDANTKSSLREAPLLTPMVLALDGNVLALADATFLQPPYDHVLDNDRFLANIADFLTSGQRAFDLEDFPGFFRGDVAVRATSPTLLDVSTELAGFLTSGDQNARLSTIDVPSLDAVVIGLYSDRSSVNHILQSEQITISQGEIRSPSTLPMPEATTGMVVLNTQGGRNVVVALAATEDDLALVVGTMISGTYRTGLVSPTLALFDLG